MNYNTDGFNDRTNYIITENEKNNLQKNNENKTYDFKENLEKDSQSGTFKKDTLPQKENLGKDNLQKNDSIQVDTKSQNGKQSSSDSIQKEKSLVGTNDSGNFLKKGNSSTDSLGRNQSLGLRNSGISNSANGLGRNQSLGLRNPNNSHSFNRNQQSGVFNPANRNMFKKF